ncbi:hypothetical protein [Actinomadura oligospora]|uniref:hypothetical protein n=1 Tax=Actinomadura oligospora TaxID=111804 RepID=UPI00047C3DBC|nr:hypothetical protein [Actinomadura oligospora]
MPISPPAAAHPVAEPVPHLLRLKTSLVKRWSHTRMRELFEEFDLATYLWALNREPEALEILDSITSAIPASNGDYNIWSPVVAMHALQARILRAAPTSGENGPEQAASKAVLADPGLADNPSYIASLVTEAEPKFQAAAAERSRASSCRNLSRVLLPLFVLSELTRARHPFTAYYTPSEPDRLIPMGRQALATRLTP